MLLPKLKLHPAPEWQKARLKRWLLEWEIDQDFGDPEWPTRAKPLNRGVDRGTLPVTPVSEELPPDTGQIRLLCPSIRAASQRLLYVAVLDAAQGKASIAPFGRFSEPCLPGELLTGRAAPGFQVVCLWNCVTMPLALLAQSWLVDELSDQELVDMRTVEHAEDAAMPLPEHLQQRVGPPYWHLVDPRNEYLTEERAMADELLKQAAASTSIEYPSKEISLPRAADPHASYDVHPTDDEA